MPSAPDTSALQRFARDLRRIREDRDVALAAVHADTQVPQSQLQSFEAGTLYETSSLNLVYLRGFVRTYAEAIGLPPDPVLDHLDSALSGEYENQLAAQYLDVPPSVEEPEEGLESDVEHVPSSLSPASEGPIERSDRPAISSSRQTPSSWQEGASFGTWEALWSKHRSKLLVAMTSLVLFGVVAALISTYLGTDTSPSDSVSDPAPRPAASVGRPSPDSQAVTDATETEVPPRADVTLGDTLYVTVLATADVRGMRVRQDDDLRRPYWIRDGQAKVFSFTRRIVIQNQLDSLRLLLERYPYPVTRTDEEGRIVITRDTAQQFFDTLRATPSPVPVSPDTVWGGAPSSKAIHRPQSVILTGQMGR